MAITLPGVGQSYYQMLDAQQPALQPPQQEQQPGLLSGLFGGGGGGGGGMTPLQQAMLAASGTILKNSNKPIGMAVGAAVEPAMQQYASAQKLFSEDEEKKRKERARMAFSKMITSDG